MKIVETLCLLPYSDNENTGVEAVKIQNNLSFNFINKCKLEILRCAGTPTSYVMDGGGGGGGGVGGEIQFDPTPVVFPKIYFLEMG